VFNTPIYRNAIWGLRVVDPGTGSVLVDLRPDHQFFIGSVRKIFSVGALLEQIGPQHTYNTRVYRQGQMDSSGILHGDLILVASGDLTMGGRTNPDGSVAISDYDHNEADSLGNQKQPARPPSSILCGTSSSATSRSPRITDGVWIRSSTRILTLITAAALWSWANSPDATVRAISRGIEAFPPHS
jgi:hypothetical protein